MNYYDSLAKELDGNTHVLRYSLSVNDEIAALAGVELHDTPITHVNSSGSAYDALQSFAKARGLDPATLPSNTTLQFVGQNQITQWQPRVITWAKPLAEELGWPLSWLDDGDLALQTAPIFSYIDLMANILSDRPDIR